MRGTQKYVTLGGFPKRERAQALFLLICNEDGMANAFSSHLGP